MARTRYLLAKFYPRQSIPAILNYANHREGKGGGGGVRGATRGVIEGDWVGRDQFCIVYLHASGQAHKASELITEAIWIQRDLSREQ